MVVGSVKLGKVSLLDASEFGPGDASRIESHLESFKVGRVIEVLPSANTVCRTCALPDTDPEQLDQALRLQAEAQLLGNAPEHRSAMAVLPHAFGETSRIGCVMTWPQTAGAPTPPISEKLTYAPDIAGLAALLDTLRPAEPLLWLDGQSGSIALALTHANGAMLRAMREDSESASIWRRAVVRSFVESAMNVGHSTAFVDGAATTLEGVVAGMDLEDARLIIPEEVIDHASNRVDNARSDRAWWSTYGIGVGVLLAVAGPLASLTTMREEPDTGRPSRLASLMETLSQPRAAMLTVVACLIILAITPIAMSGLSYMVLKMRHGDVGQDLKVIRDAERELAMYDLLAEKTWSNTKVLGDIACNIPPGVDVEVMRVQQSDQSFTMAGRVVPDKDRGVSALDNLNDMKSKLGSTGIFTQVSFDAGEPDAYGAYDFSMSGKVSAPHRQFEYPIEDDYGAWTYAERLAGIDPSEGGQEFGEATDEGSRPAVAVNTTPSRPSSRTPVRPTTPRATTDPPPGRLNPADARKTDNNDEDSTEEEARRTGRTPPRRVVDRSGDSDASSRADVDQRVGSGAGDNALPELLSVTEINSMSKDEVRQALIEVSKASRLHKDDPEIAGQLREQRQLLMKRLREAADV